MSVFKYSNYLPWCKIKKKTNNPFLRKIPNWQTDRPTGRQIDNGHFIGPSVWQESSKTVPIKNLKILKTVKALYWLTIELYWTDWQTSKGFILFFIETPVVWKDYFVIFTNSQLPNVMSCPKLMKPSEVPLAQWIRTIKTFECKKSCCY